MIVVLTEKQAQQIIEALEEKPEQVEDKWSILNHLKMMVRFESTNQQEELDDIPF